ncbi:hypothetical protein LEP1GSC059_2936 [Leptospira noguchii serovar Panama str. CZ214]|uniref:Uncharacterized protein n=1 Tax=Leptospira noguchii serovar Panama str. CZ214 TaxID=1001595 RepID=T0FP41_9LEPT|nr:hypothetical protein LEP1GSC059_2936 [Leptospira noguchii serovar Panama str. CZ214]
MKAIETEELSKMLFQIQCLTLCIARQIALNSAERSLWIALNSAERSLWIAFYIKAKYCIMFLLCN